MLSVLGTILPLLRLLSESNDDSDFARYSNPSLFFVPALLLFLIAHFGLNTTSNLETYMEENSRLDDLFQRVFEFAVSGFCQGVLGSERVQEVLSAIENQDTILGIKTRLEIEIENVINGYLNEAHSTRSVYVDSIRQASRGDRAELEGGLRGAIENAIAECKKEITEIENGFIGNASSQLSISEQENENKTPKLN